MSNSSYRVGLSRGKFLATLLLLLVAGPISAFRSVPPPQGPVFFHRLLLLRAEDEAAPWCWPGRRIHSSSSSVLAGRRSAVAPGFEEELPPSRRLSDTNEALLASSSAGVRQFLGRGPQAVVREGCVLVAPPNEYHHYYRQAAIFIYEIGLDNNTEENDDDDEVDNYIIRGVILDHPTPFTWHEMMGGGTLSLQDSALGENRLFRGGDQGGPDGIVLLHRHYSRPDQSPDDAEIGSSGIYQGGWEAAVAAVQAGEASVDDYKAFFNYCEFSETELESLLVDDESGDSWASVEVDTDMVLNADWDRGDCWKRIRNAISQHMQQQQQH